MNNILLDIGCFNGRTNSITYKLLKRKKENWKGYLIEPNYHLNLDIIDNLDDDYHGLSKKQIQSILKLDWDIMHDAIYDATKHFDLSEYYRNAIEDTVDILKEKYIDQTKK